MHRAILTALVPIKMSDSGAGHSFQLDQYIPTYQAPFPTISFHLHGMYAACGESMSAMKQGVNHPKGSNQSHHLFELQQRFPATNTLYRNHTPDPNAGLATLPRLHAIFISTLRYGVQVPVFNVFCTTRRSSHDMTDFLSTFYPWSLSDVTSCGLQVGLGMLIHQTRVAISTAATKVQPLKSNLQ